MSNRTDNLAAKLEQSIDGLRSAVESSTQEQWSAPCSDGEWSQGFAAYHAAAAIEAIAQAVKSVADGNPFEKITMAQIDAGNAEQWKAHADCSKAETLELISNSAEPATKMVRSLTDEQLDRKVQLLEGMPEMTVEMMIDLALAGHSVYHTGTITSARQASGAVS